MKINEKYSDDFTGQSLVDVDPAEFNDTIIVGGCFWQEGKPDTVVFPAGMRGVTFRRCNLDNVYVPPGNTIEADCTHKRIKCFPPTPKEGKADPNEGAIDWQVDEKGMPTEPLHKRRFAEEKRSVDPADIPADHEIEVTIPKVDFEKIVKDQWEAGTAKGDKPLKDSFAWFKETPIVVKSKTQTVDVQLPTEAWLKMRAKGDFGQFDSEPQNVTVPLKDKPGTVRLRGSVTRMTVRGKAWLHRGETTADSDERKRILVDVRKAVK